MNRRQIQMMMLTTAMASSTANVAVASGKHADNSLPLSDPIGFGAKGDGKALDSRAINAAIDACNKAGGGIVYLRPGTYRSGTVVRQSNVTLYLEAGATILGSLDLNDYMEYPGLPYDEKPGPPPKGDANQRHLILAVDAENVTLAGPGRIDGQGTHFIEPSGRPDFLEFGDLQQARRFEGPLVQTARIFLLARLCK
jgi:polygalacturonase